MPTTVILPNGWEVLAHYRRGDSRLWEKTYTKAQARKAAAALGIGWHVGYWGRFYVVRTTAQVPPC